MAVAVHQEKSSEARGSDAAPQRRAAKTSPSPRHGFVTSPRRPSGGLPDPLRSNVERMSGFSMDDVRVHRNSPRPAALGALAFTQGNEIHLGAGQERHLPHEAWHVVQQKQGRVSATTQMKSERINDDAGLEREADAMGARAASGAAPRPASAAPAAAAPAAPGVVQRKVGFEFETNMLVTRNGQALAKKDVVGTGQHQGFTVEADEAGGGRSEIEFVVYPPVEEGPGGLNVLTGVMDGITAYAQQLVARGANAFGLDTATGIQADSVYAVTPLGQLEAGPQATTGLDLGKIGQLGTISRGLLAPQSQQAEALLGPRFGTAAPVELRTTMDRLQARAEGISQQHQGISGQLQGLLVLIRNYLAAGADANKAEDLSPEQRTLLALNYPKRIADVVLARTDFARLFMLLPKSERRRFTEDRASWVPFVLAGLPNVEPGDSVIERGIQVDEDNLGAGLVKPALTVRQWLLGMIGADAEHKGVDRLRNVPGAESMGELGDKTEKVGNAESPVFSTQLDVGIFEFRGAQANKIPLNRWKPFALEFQRYITAVHD